MTANARFEQIDSGSALAAPLTALGIALAPLTLDDARACISRIRDHYQSFWFELRDFHAGRGWIALGYSSFKGCIEQELGMSEQRAYQLLAAAQVHDNLAGDTQHVLSIELTEGHARQLAPLPPEEQRATWAEAIRTDPAGRPSITDLRRIVKERSEEIKAERPPRVVVPASAPVIVPCLIAQGDAVNLPLYDDSVHLQVTSCPYGLNIDYVDSPDDPDAWIPFMRAWLTEAYRVAAERGRLALNVPLDTTLGGWRPTYAQSVACAEMVGWTYRYSIVWAENNVNKSVARGSVDSPSAPHIITPVEMVGVFHKGEWKRSSDARPDIDHQDWLDWTNGLWTFPGESNAWEGHPAAFPPQLPRRLIQLLSFPGDTVLDQFCGSGTTVVQAHLLGREAIGFDISPEYVASARRRLKAAIEAQQ